MLCPGEDLPDASFGDFLSAETVQRIIQQHVDAQHPVEIQFILSAQHHRRGSDDVALHHDDQQYSVCIDDGGLDELDLIRMDRRLGDHRSVVGILRQVLYELLQRRLQLIDLLEHLRLHIIDFMLMMLHQLIDVEAVALITRDTTGGGMRLHDIAHLLEVAHLVTNRSRTKAESGILADRT